MDLLQSASRNTVSLPEFVRKQQPREGLRFGELTARQPPGVQTPGGGWAAYALWRAGCPFLVYF